MPLPLDGIKVLDFTGLQAGPACTQQLAWFGADVLKIEKVGEGDVTHGQFRDTSESDALHFRMFNSNKRSIELNMDTPEGKKILEQLIKEADILVESFGSDAENQIGLSWETIHSLNPRLIFGSITGFGGNSRFSDLKMQDSVAQCTGGAASTTGFWNGPPTLSGVEVGDSNAGMHLLIGLLAALFNRRKTGKGDKVSVSMQDAVLNLCRVKLRDQQRLEQTGVLEEYPQYPNGTFGETVPRGGNASGGGQPGWVLKCKGWETDANAYIYLTLQAHNWANTCKAIGRPEWIDDPAYNTVQARQTHLAEIFAEIETWLADKTKFEAVEIFRKFDVPSGPVLSMKELQDDPDLRASQSIVEVKHPEHGTYLTVGTPQKFSGFTPVIKPAPLLGEHTDEVLADLGYSPEQIARLHDTGVIGKTTLVTA